MQTSKAHPEHRFQFNDWTVEELENENGLHFICPTGYIFGFKTIQDAFDFLVQGSDGAANSIHKTMYGDIHKVDRHAVITAFSVDVWINPNHAHNESVAFLDRLAKTILDYVDAKWIQKTI